MLKEELWVRNFFFFTP